MTPERKEEIATKHGLMDWHTLQKVTKELLAALEETQHQLLDHGPLGRNYTNEQYATLQQELTESQQTIARQREALIATGLPEWAVDALGEGAKEGNESVTLRPEVKWFAELMENQLRVNEHKGGWADQSYYLISCLNSNFNDLITSVHEVEEQEPGEWREKQRSAAQVRAVNVANFAMMLADNAKNDRLEKEVNQP